MAESASSIPVQAATTRVRSLLPKEHGAWAQFFFPLVTGFVLGGPGLAPVLLAVSAVAVFLMHEPALVLVGRRGVRAERDSGVRARRWFVAGLLVSVVTGPAGVWLAPREGQLAAMVSLGLGAALVFAISRDEEKTTWGEVLAATALSSVGLAVALAGGAAAGPALVVTGAWVGAFTTATFAVRAVIARSKERPAGALVAGALVSGTGSVAAMALWGPVEGAVFLSLATGPTMALAVFPPHARRLKQVGWGLVGACVLLTVFAVRVAAAG